VEQEHRRIIEDLEVSGSTVFQCYGFPVLLFYLTTRILVTKASGLLNPSLPAVEKTRYTPVVAD
jgi:hypothetical protein